MAKIMTKDDQRKDFRLMIKNRLNELDMSMNQLAKEVCYDYSNLKNFLSGKRANIPLHILEKIFWVLNLYLS